MPAAPLPVAAFDAAAFEDAAAALEAAVEDPELEVPLELLSEVELADPVDDAPGELVPLVALGIELWVLVELLPHAASRVQPAAAKDASRTERVRSAGVRVFMGHL